MSLHRSLKARIKAMERQIRPDYVEPDNMDPRAREAMTKAGEAWLKEHRLKECPDPMPAEMAEFMIAAGLKACEGPSEGHHGANVASLGRTQEQGQEATQAGHRRGRASDRTHPGS